MNAGKRRHRVEIQSPAEAQGVTGEPVPAWAMKARRWASVEPLNGRELLNAQAVESEITIRVRMLYVEGITPGDRIVKGARTLEIIAVVDPEERRRELELLCKEAL